MALARDAERGVEALYGRGRQRRPRDTDGAAVPCPFCPGAEGETGEELARLGTPWRARVTVNRFPVVEPPEGAAEVVIETPLHDADWPELGAAHVADLLALYGAREAAALERWAYVSIVRNRGARAAASLAHPHGQVVALAAEPPHVRAFGAAHEPCPVCAEVAAPSARTVAESPRFVAFVPAACRASYELRIAPRDHAARLRALDAAARAELATVAIGAVRALGAVRGPDLHYNTVLASSLRRPARHWTVDLVPRRYEVGGFELATGGWLVGVPPEAAAAALRAAGTPDRRAQTADRA